MNKHCFAVGILAAALSSCTTVPVLDPLQPISVAHIVDRIQCELKSAVSTYRTDYPWILTWSAAYELTLQVDAESGIATDNSFIRSRDWGTFTFGIGGGVTGTATRVASLKFAMPIKNILTYECLLPSASGVGLDSNLGLTDWMGRALNAADSKDAFPHVDTFGHNMSFVIVASANLSPKWALAAYNGPGGALSGKRTDTHTLNIAFAAPEGAVKGKGQVAAGSRLRLENTLRRQDLQLLLPRSPLLR